MRRINECFSMYSARWNSSQNGAEVSLHHPCLRNFLQTVVNQWAWNREYTPLSRNIKTTCLITCRFPAVPQKTALTLQNMDPTRPLEMWWYLALSSCKHWCESYIDLIWFIQHIPQMLNQTEIWGVKAMNLMAIMMPWRCWAATIMR